MTEHPSERDLEARLAASFRGGDLPAAPGRMLDLLERTPDEALRITVREGLAGRPRRSAVWLVGLAAAVALGGVVVLGGGGRDRLPVPSESPARPLGTVITYEIEWGPVTPFDEASLARAVELVQQRLDATGVVGATVRAVDRTHLVVVIPSGIEPEPFRRFVGQRGQVAFVPLGHEHANEGDRIDLATHPALFGGEGIADARVGADQTGGRTVEFDLTPPAADAFGAFTTDHVGQSFAIVLDGRVVSAPLINSAIAGGNIQISKSGTIGGWPLEEAQRLVAVLIAPLPAPIREISVEGAAHDPSGGPLASPSG